MALPEFVITNNANEADSLFDASGDPFIKAAGRPIPVDSSPVDSAPHLVEDATLLAGTGHQAVAAGPVRTQLVASSTPCVRVTVKADTANSNTLYVGLSTVTADATSTGGLQLSPGESFTFGIDDVSSVYIHGTAAEGASFAYEL